MKAFYRVKDNKYKMFLLIDGTTCDAGTFDDQEAMVKKAKDLGIMELYKEKDKKKKK